MRNRFFSTALLLFLLLPACRIVDDDEAASQPAVSEPQPASPEPPRQVSVPAVGFQRFDPAVLERYRLDPAWRTAAERDRLGRLESLGEPQSGAGPQSAAPPPPAATTEPPPPAPATAEEGPEEVIAALELQVPLDRAGFSPGVIDGRSGQNTEKALYWFQFARGLRPTGALDDATRAELASGAPAGALVEVEVTAEDLAGPFTEIPDDVYEQAKLECLCYASAAEAIAERYHTTPALLAEVNPTADLDALTAGTVLRVPGVEPLVRGKVGGAPAGERVAQILVSKRGFYTQALDAQGRILFHAPSTVGSKYDPSPAGEFHVTGVAFDPTFHYQPTLFHEVPDEEAEANLPAGPNSPVGLVWIDLSKPHHGIHGTAVPETIGYTSSHGCIRLTNWDALALARRVRPGVPVRFRD